MKTTRPHERNVLIAFPLSRIARTDKLAGIFRYLSGSSRWRIKMSDVDDLNLEGIDGIIITGHPPAGILRQLEKATIPTVTIAVPCRRQISLLQIETDGAAIAQSVCNDLLSRQQYASLVLVSKSDTTPFSRSCLDAMRRFAQDHHLFFASLSGNLATLADLPRPVAAFALNDNLAHDAIRAGQAEGLTIPDELSVIGFGNEGVFCESVRPTISSVDQDFEQQGFRAAELLDALMSGRSGQLQRIFQVGLKSIVHRDSTPERKTGDNLVKRALKFIEQKAKDGIGVRDVVAEMRVSRRLLDLRFSESAGETILSAIVRQRLADTKRELLSSDDPIAEVCERCGWKSENHPKKLFARHFGVSMREFRNSRKPAHASVPRNSAFRYPLEKARPMSLLTRQPSARTGV